MKSYPSHPVPCRHLNSLQVNGCIQTWLGPCLLPPWLFHDPHFFSKDQRSPIFPALLTQFRALHSKRLKQHVFLHNLENSNTKISTTCIKKEAERLIFWITPCCEQSECFSAQLLIFAYRVVLYQLHNFSPGKLYYQGDQRSKKILQIG